jgi:Domain of unknown function (DUF4124)
VRKAMHFSCQLTGVVLTVLWLFQTPLYAAIYKWKDDQGKLHFTDSKSKIPLKYRDQFEKFRGVAEPSPKESGSPAGAAAGSEKGETEASQGETEGESAGSAEKPPEKSKYSKKQIELLKKVKDNLTKIWASSVKLVKHIEPTKLNGKYYIASQRKSASQKKAIIKQIGASEIPSLKKVRKFLKKSSVNDAKINMGDPAFMEKVQRIRQAIEGDIPIEKDLIEQLKVDIGPQDNSSDEAGTKTTHYEKPKAPAPAPIPVDLTELVEN